MTTDERIKYTMTKISNISNILFSKIKQAVLSKDDSIAFWGGLSREIRQQFNNLKLAFKNHYSKIIVIEYLENYKKEINRIKQYKSIDKSKMDFKKMLKSVSHKRIINSIISNGVNSFNTGIDTASKKINSLMNNIQLSLTKQKKISIQALSAKDKNKLIDDMMAQFKSEGYEGTLLKDFKAALAEFAIDEDYIVITDKNGKPRKYEIKDYAKMVIRTKIIETAAAGTINIALDIGSDLVQVSDHNTDCEICEPVEGNVYSISGNDPDFPIMDFTLPIHPNCFSIDTEIYTNNGWKYFFELNKSKDKCLTLNSDNFNLEYAEIKEIIQDRQTELINFKNRYLDLLVTKNHRMYYMSDSNRKMKKNKYNFIEAEKLLNYKSGRFYASCCWQGKDNINDLWFEFLGYYLSEGHVSKYKKNSYNICISQSSKVNKIKYDKIYNCMVLLFKDKHICKRENCLSVYNMKLGKYLKNFGKSHEKYIPLWIKESSKDKIKIFLDAYLLGDGYYRKRFSKFLNCFTEERQYFSTSKKIADDIGELILKTGKRPSFYTDKVKGKLHKFRNGNYILNHNLYRIKECNNINYSLDNMKISKISYNDFVYCVNVEKNNTIYVRRNGQCVWTGNCQHTITVAFREILERRGIDKYL
jgi:hypothetical protein